VRFLFDIQGAFFAMALFLDDETRLHEAGPCDAVGLSANRNHLLLIYVGLYYVPSLSLDHPAALLREQVVMLLRTER